MTCPMRLDEALHAVVALTSIVVHCAFSLQFLFVSATLFCHCSYTLHYLYTLSLRAKRSNLSLINKHYLWINSILSIL